MTSDYIPAFSAATLLACIATFLPSVLAQSLPYNPNYLIQAADSKIYRISPDETPQFSVYESLDDLSTNNPPKNIADTLPFLKDGATSFVPVATRNGLTVFSGECSDADQELDLWTYGLGEHNQTWTQMHTTSSDTGLAANFLAAAFTFPNSQLSDSDDLYVFGGMCPNGAANASAWTSDASYSNTLLAISYEQGTDYEVSLTSTRSPPIAEAGLSITPLQPTKFQKEDVAAQQNFVLLGGHTQNAFINMSQVAMLSMPEQAWAFIGIQQPTDAVVEPRSGHTAVMSEDGTKIYVYGGWVGDVSNPATPQLAVLEIGQGYGGNGSWTWVVPKVQEQYPAGANGIYGHAATMLPGDVMMVTAGYQIASSVGRAKRDTVRTMFFDTQAATWSESYSSSKADANHGSSSKVNKAGLGAGLGIGIPAIAVAAIVWFFYSRRKKQERRLREQHLRDLAMGTNDAFSTADISRPASRSMFSGYRSASWGARQEERIEGQGGSYPDEHAQNRDGNSHYDERQRNDGPRMPDPSQTLRQSLRGRGPPGFGSQVVANPPMPGVISTIEEVEERSERASYESTGAATRRPLSDPFRDPTGHDLTDDAAQRRKDEVQTWVDDWQSAAESMQVSRSASKANSRTYSNLSAYHSSSSGEKADRTNSDLSESSRSNYSVHRSAGGSVARTASQRSGSAGYTLFSAAAAAMSRLAGGRSGPENTMMERSSSKRIVSHGDLAELAARKRSNSVDQSRGGLTPLAPAMAEYFTPPESPVKDYKNHSRKRSNSFTNQSSGLTNSGKKAFGVLGNGAKRILTGTNTVSVQHKINDIETRSRDSSPTKSTGGPEMREVEPRRVSSTGATFWKHRQGAKDWEESNGEGSSTIRRRSGRPMGDDDQLSGQEDDWDIETAVQQRVVQVMFTVPKEKLRVVNADSLSMISRTDTNASRSSDRSDEGKEARELQRMSRVTEDIEDDSTVVGSAQGSMLHPHSALDRKGKEVRFRRGDGGGGGTSVG